MEAGGPRRNRNGTRYRRICFTVNNWTAQEYASLLLWKPTWLVIGKEVGEGATPHLQGAAILGTQMSLSTIKKIPGLARAHIEPMMGTPQDSLVYCSKEDPIPHIHGVMPEPGKRNDLLEAVESMRNGFSTMRNFADTHGATLARYPRGLTLIRSLYAEPRIEPPKVIWIFGPTGVGKTRAATDFANAHYGGYWMSTGNLQWFDGYDGESVAIIDDFRGKHCTFPFLLRLLDRYPFRVPIKGGFMEWVPKVIFITCPYSPSEVFEVRGKHLPEDVKQMERRITKIIEWKDQGFSLTSVIKAFEKLILAQPAPAIPAVIAPSTADIIDLTEEFESDSDLERYGDGEEEKEEESYDGVSLETYLFGSK